MVLSWWGVPGLLVVIAAFGAALVALRTAPRRPLNQRLATVLVLDALFSGIGSGIIFLTDSRPAVAALTTVAAAAQAALSFQYLAFLGVALQTRLVRPFRSRRAWGWLTLASLAAAAVVLAMPRRFFSEPYDPGFAPWNYQHVELGIYLTQWNGLTGLFGLVAAITAYMHTPAGSAARTRAKWFAIAFGVRDLFAVSLGLVFPILRPVPVWGDILYNPFQCLALLVYILVLSYGVLQAQLFDIPLRVKFAIQQSTVAGAVAAAFFVGSEVMESFIPVNGIILGLLTAGVIVLALRPVQRAAERIATALMPGVEATPRYIDARKLEVYRAALEGAAQDGVVTDKEMAILQTLRSQLGVTDDEARTVAQAVGIEIDTAAATATPGTAMRH